MSIARNAGWCTRRTIVMASTRRPLCPTITSCSAGSTRRTTTGSSQWSSPATTPNNVWISAPGRIAGFASGGTRKLASYVASCAALARARAGAASRKCMRPASTSSCARSSSSRASRSASRARSSASSGTLRCSAARAISCAYSRSATVAGCSDRTSRRAATAERFAEAAAAMAASAARCDASAASSASTASSSSALSAAAGAAAAAAAAAPSANGEGGAGAGAGAGESERGGVRKSVGSVSFDIFAGCDATRRDSLTRWSCDPDARRSGRRGAPRRARPRRRIC